MKIVTNYSLVFSLVLILLVFPACRQSKQVFLETENGQGNYINMPIAGTKYAQNSSFFDEDIEAFVLEEEVDKPFTSETATLAHASLADNVQEFTLEQIDNKADVETIYFAYDSKELRPDQKETLSRSLEKVKTWAKEGKIVCCKGHSCRWHGTRAYNIALSSNRARIVSEYLEKQCTVPGATIKTFGVGNEEPIAFEDTKDGQSPNRRVEIYALAA